MPLSSCNINATYLWDRTLVGYIAYSQLLCRLFFADEPDSGDERRPGWFRTTKIGVTRTLIGLIVGAAYAGLARTGIFGDLTSNIFLLGLFPVRIGEWLLLLRIAFKEKIHDWKLTASAVGVGIIVSYCLDFVGIVAGLVLPGGATWIC